MSGSAATFDAAGIKVLKGLEAVRYRPDMYIGNTADGSGLHMMVAALVEDALAHGKQGASPEIGVSLNTDGSVTVMDNLHFDFAEWRCPDMASAVKRMMTELSVGGCFGRSIVNALSSRLDLTIWHGGREYAIAFADGDCVAPLEIAAAEQGRSGTRITFAPSPDIFANHEFDYKVVYQKLRALMGENPGVQCVLEDWRSDPPKRADMLSEGQKE